MQAVVIIFCALIESDGDVLRASAAAVMYTLGKAIQQGGIEHEKTERTNSDHMHDPDHDPNTSLCRW